jgi:DNA-binding CsgD family transcriptional regulator
VHTVPARPGLIIVNAALGIVGSNSEALRILTFPEDPGRIPRLESWLSNKVNSIFLDRQPPFRVANEFRSAKRTYLCRSFPLGNLEHRPAAHPKNGQISSAGLLVLLLERINSEAITIAEVSRHFGLTDREQETVKFLLEGLTSKEIAQRMKISPNTVKAFIRLVMVKMDVSTRSGIIGKIAGWKASSGLELANGNGSSRG